MLVRNETDQRDRLALTLVKDFGLTLRDLQLALEWSAEAELAFDVVLLEMKVIDQKALAAAAKSAEYVLTAEQHAVRRAPAQGTRTFSRHTFHLDVGFKDWEGLELSYANNISRGGIGVTMPLTADTPKKGTTVAMALTLPDGHVVELEGKVCYSRDGNEHRHVGVQLFPNSEDLLVIDRLLRSQSETEG